MCPNECPGLFDVWGDNFDRLYTQYEKEGRGRKTLKARELFYVIINILSFLFIKIVINVKIKLYIYL